MTTMLRAEGITINRKRVQRLMRRMGIAALGPKPKTTKPAPDHKIGRQDFPLPPARRGDRPAEPSVGGGYHVQSDWSRLPLPGGDHRPLMKKNGAGRAVLAWRLSNTMDAAVCVDALDEALTRFERPDIFNTDQGSPFTSAAFTGRLTSAGIRISMDGRGRWIDNVFIERLWWSLKDEDVSLKGNADGCEARTGIAAWIRFYNAGRPHQTLAGRAPMAVWRDASSASSPATPWTWPPSTLAGG